MQRKGVMGAASVGCLLIPPYVASYALEGRRAESI
jgi:hypothetical protein